MLAGCRLQAENLRRLSRTASLRENGEISMSSEALFHAAVIIESLCAASEKAVEGIARLDRSEIQLISERDQVIDALDGMYEAVLGRKPEWSSAFGFSDAINEVAEHMFSLEGAQLVPDEEEFRELFEKWCSVNIERNKWHPEYYAHLPAREQWDSWRACLFVLLHRIKK